MSSQFSTLMALSAMQTQQSQAAVQSALTERKRKEGLRRKEQEAREEKEKELEAKLRLKYFEDKKRERERLERKERERAAKEAEKEKREIAQRDALRYGPKKAAANKAGGSGEYPSVDAHTREELRKRRLPVDDDDESGSGLTREEKRRRRLQNDLNFGGNRSARRSGSSGEYRRGRKRLPGGALDVMRDGTVMPTNDSQSVKARLAAMPNTLTRLNVVKRDTRTIDEIVRDRDRERERRVLNGDQAKEFHDWFGKEKKKDVGKKTEVTTADSRTGSPGSRSATSRSPAPAPSASAALLKKSAIQQTPPVPLSSKYSAPVKTSKPKLSTKPSVPDMNPKPSKPAKTPIKSKNLPSAYDSISNAPYSSGNKRQRSPSLSSDSSTSLTRKQPETQEEDSYGSVIWKLFGRDRSRYVSNDVDSDDEDMEADAIDMEKEELRSARIARKEDEAALRAEKLRDDEKRRKRLEKELR